MARNKNFSSGYLEGANPHPPRWYHRSSPKPSNGPKEGETKSDYRERTNFDLPPDQEAYLKGKADTMESLEAYRKPGQLPRPPKEPRERKERTPRPPSARQQKAAMLAPSKKLSSLARLAKGRKR